MLTESSVDSAVRNPMPLRLEALEPRLMLSAADWVGIWQVSGQMMEANTNPTSAWFEHEAEKLNLTLTEVSPGQYQMDIQIDGEDEQFLLTEVGNQLQGNESGYDDEGDYFQLEMRMVEVAPGVAIFVGGEGGYENDAMNDLWWSGSIGGLATRGGGFTPTGRPWEGQYNSQFVELEVDSGSGAEIETGNFAANIVNLGGGKYFFEETEDPGYFDVFTVSGSYLKLFDNGYDEDGDYYESYNWIYRGPDNLLYAVGAEVGYNGSQKTDLWWVDYWVDVMEPTSDEAPSQSDWAGDWVLNGYATEADTDNGSASFDYSALTNKPFTLTDLYGDKVLLKIKPDRTDEYHLLENNGDELSGSLAEYDEDGDYCQVEIRILEVAPGVGIFVGGDGGFESDAMDDLWWSGAFTGLATKGKFTPTPRSWAGEYDATDVNLEVETAAWGGVDVEYEYFDLTITDIGANQYSLVEPAWPGEEDIFTLQGNLLQRHISGYDEDDDYYEEHCWIFRGPNDMLYYAGGEAGYDGPQQTDLWWADHWAGVLVPKEGFEYKPDLVVTNMVPDSLSALTNQKMSLKITTTNQGDAKAVPGGSPDFDTTLYLRGDQVFTPLDGSDVAEYAYRSLASGRSVTSTFKFVAPDTPGTYYLCAMADDFNSVAETHEDNNWGQIVTLVVADPFVDLSGVITDIAFNAQAVPGDKGSVAVEVTNNGNIPVKGKINIRFYGSVNQTLEKDGTDVLFSSIINTSVNLKANASKVYKSRITMPGDTLPGEYYILVDIDSENTIAETHEDNNLAVSDGTGEVVWKFGDFSGRKGVKLTLLDTNGVPVTFTLKSGGFGEVTGGSDFAEVILTSTTEKSVFTIKTKGRGAETSVGDITADNSLKSILAKTTDLRGGIDIGGTISMLVMDDIADDHTINIGASANPKAGVTLSFDQVADLNIDSDTPIKSLKATEWIGGSLIAPWVSSISIKGNSRAGISGDFIADVTLTGADAKGVALKKFAATGEIISDIDLLAGAGGTIAGGSWTAGSFNGTFLKSIMLKGKRPDRSGAGGLVGDFGAAIDLTGDDGRGMSLNMLKATGTISSQINLAAGASSITAGRWDGGGLNAAMVKTLSVKGDKKAGLQGDLANAAFDVTGVIGRRGDRSAFGSLKVVGDINNTFINANGDVKALMAATIRDSQVYVGYDEGVGEWGTGTFASSYTLSSLKLSGIRGEDTSCFIASTIAVGRIKNGLIVKMDGVNEGDPFGIIIDNPDSKISVKDPSWKWVAPDVAPGETAEDGFDDFLVRNL